MPAKSHGTPGRVAPEVEAYISAIPAEHRPVFDRLHDLVLDTLPDARVVISYNMPAYLVAGGRVSLSSGKAGVSLATTVPEPIAAFKVKHDRRRHGTTDPPTDPAGSIPVYILRP